MMQPAYIVDLVRSPIAKLGGALRSVRPDDLAALVLRELLARHPGLDPAAVDDVVLGAANQAGEDNRTVARMAALPLSMPAGLFAAAMRR